MTRFFRWQFWRSRSRYWRMKCREAESRCLDLVEQHGEALAKMQEQMDAEVWRNRSREDTFVSASILGAKGMFGVSPRLGPALTQKPQSLLQVAAPAMSGVDKMEFDTQWLPYAIQNGISPQQAERDFLKELQQRKAFNDEPSM
jgi:hypothetical protein